MSSEGLKPFKKKEGTVIPKKRELVKTKILKAILSFLRRSDSKKSSDGKRVYPTRRWPPLFYHGVTIMIFYCFVSSVCFICYSIFK